MQIEKRCALCVIMSDEDLSTAKDTWFAALIFSILLWVNMHPMKTTYQHLFFDLDRTLWDFDTSASITFKEIYKKHKLKSRGIETVDIFHEVYSKHNEALWDKYRVGGITKEVLRGKRFVMTLNEFGIEDSQLGEAIGDDYVTLSPQNVSLFPHAFEILDYLEPKYILHLITNGFSETQYTKLKVSGLGKYFKEVITSEEAGVKKPDGRIFQFALDRAGANLQESLMIGDDYEVDIIGARNFGMDQVLFDPHELHQANKSTFYINDLIELKGYL